jgi:CRISPR-associated protein Cst1
MLNYTGHPFVDVGIAAILAQAGKGSPDQLTADDLAATARYIEQNYVVAPLRGHLTMAFTSNAWFIQDAFNPDKPELSPEKRAERRTTRDRWAAHHVRQWEPSDEASAEVCIFTGLPAALRELSGKLAGGRIGRNQMPLLQGDDAINFFPNGNSGLPVSGMALLALQFMPMGCAKCGVGLLAVHSDNAALTQAFAGRFFDRNIQGVLQAQAAGEDKLPGAQRSLKTLLIEELTAIEQDRLNTERRSERAASISAYNFNNGKSPQLTIYHLPMQISSFLRIVLTATYRDVWQQIVQRGWQREQVKTDRKGNVTERIAPKYNYVYEDLFTLPQDATRFIRRYFLRMPQRTRFDDDPRSTYSTAREQQLISWTLVELFLKEVLTMDEDRIARIRLLGDKLADYTRNQGGRRFFRTFFTEQNTSNFLSLLSKTNIAYVKYTKGSNTLFDLESYIEVFMDGAELMRPDWRLARDLVLIRMVEQLKDWIAQNPDALPEEEVQPEQPEVTA